MNTFFTKNLLLISAVFFCCKAFAQEVYLLESSQDSLFLKIGNLNAEGRILVSHQFFITADQKIVSDKDLLRDSYFIGNSVIVLGQCTADIKKLISNTDAHLNCINGHQQNLSLAKAPVSNGSMILIDSSVFENQEQIFPYTLEFYSKDLSQRFQKITLYSNRIDVSSSNTEKVAPRYISFVEYSSRIDRENTTAKLYVIDLQKRNRVCIDSVDLREKSNNNNILFRSSISWLNESTITYITGQTIGGNFSKINIWKYSLHAGKKEPMFESKVTIQNKDSYVTSGNYKHHLYTDKKILLIEDHNLKYIDSGKISVVYTNDDQKRKILIDAIFTGR